jgi:single-stranded DNA-binding protein
MNTFTGIVNYVGEDFTDDGLRFMKLSLPKVGKSGEDVPLYMMPNKAAGETFDAFAPGIKLLVNGRLYPSRRDYKMYFVPNQQVQVVQGALTMNKVNLTGGIGYIGDKKREDLLNFTIMCNAPAQILLGHNWEDSLSFRIEAWGDDCKRIERLGHVGRLMSMEGVLRYSTWTNAEGQQRGGYSIRTRSGLYSFLGANKKKRESEEVRMVSSTQKNEAPKAVIAEPYQSAVQPSAPATTSAPVADADNLPF